MPNPIVYSYTDSADVAKSLGEHVVKIQNAALATKPTFNVAVSGGSLVKTLKNGLVNRTDVQWDKWNIFFSDERIVALDHEDSNYGLLKKELLDHITNDKPKCFTIDPSLNTSHDIAVHYEQTLVKALGPAPVLDLVLLGCGPDGHTCSLFPGHRLLNEKTRLVAEIEDSPKPPPKRVTLTFTTLAYASNITFVAEGAGKAPVLKDIFEHPERRLPSSMVNGLHLPVTWFVNDDAIKGVNVMTSKF